MVVVEASSPGGGGRPWATSAASTARGMSEFASASPRDRRPHAGLHRLGPRLLVRGRAREVARLVDRAGRRGLGPVRGLRRAVAGVRRPDETASSAAHPCAVAAAAAGRIVVRRDRLLLLRPGCAAAWPGDGPGIGEPADRRRGSRAPAWGTRVTAGRPRGDHRLRGCPDHRRRRSAAACRSRRSCRSGRRRSMRRSACCRAR